MFWNYKNKRKAFFKFEKTSKTGKNHTKPISTTETRYNPQISTAKLRKVFERLLQHSKIRPEKQPQF